MLPAEHLIPLDQSQREELARLHLDSYPPQVGAEDLDDARREIDETFIGQFGTLRSDASWLTRAGGRLAGAILVVERSIWDDHLDGPVVIDLFVYPEARGLALGRSLVLAAMEACTSAGDRQLSLRVGDGTSARRARPIPRPGLHDSATHLAEGPPWGSQQVDRCTRRLLAAQEPEDSDKLEVARRRPPACESGNPTRARQYPLCVYNLCIVRS